MTIQLNNSQLRKINDLANPTDGGEPNYAEMYSFIYRELKDQMPADQAYWFQQAAEINAYLNDPNNPELKTQSAYFIQQMNIESLRNAGLDYSDSNIEFISNRIGEEVYKDIINTGQIPDMEYQVARDIEAALFDGKLNFSQWGGTFYFWDMVIPSDIADYSPRLAEYAGSQRRAYPLAVRRMKA